MAVGTSGRIVLEIDPLLKKQIYAALEENGITLKSWFVDAARSQLVEKKQLLLGLEEPVTLGKRNGK
jgi:hypothetical protein